ncbi:MAG: porin, partial [candidate division Zixibacteria bacterium]|nr:porin [candidate division Zixibacteria bacterium]
MTRKRKILILSAFVGLLMVAAASASAENKPAMEINWYGTVRLDASWDQNPTSHGNYVMWVSPQSLGKDDAQLNITHRASRFGFRAKNAEKQEVTIGGNVEIDMYGGGAENKVLLLLRHAYFTVQSGQFKLLAGQSWDLIAPLN